MTVKYFLLLSSLGLVLAAQAQDCGSPPSQPNMSLRDNDMSLTQFPDGTRVGYKCSLGYMTAGGSPTIVCSAGSWSSLALKCEKKNCGSAGEVQNGEVTYPVGTEFGDTAVVVCNTGFRLVGKSTLHCVDKGWMGRLPECEVVACDPLNPIQDGSYSPEKDSYQYLEVIRFTCQKGLSLIGSQSLTCSENGVFTPDPPTCSRVECEKPDVTNAQRVGGYIPSYKYRDTVTHRCNTGYKMIGEGTSVCGINGEWEPKLLSCEPKNCSKPVGGSGMSLEDKVSEIFLHDSSATFVCNDGYDPAGGSADVKCFAGVWSSVTLKCKPKSCSQPVGGSDMSLDKAFEIYPHDSSATFVCNDGFKPESGSGVVKCTTGVWSPLTLKCKPESCSKPVGGSDMSLDKDSVSQEYPHDSSATFVCNDGYKPDGSGGSGVVKCTAGAWSLVTLKCIKATGGDGDSKGNDGSNAGRDAAIAVVVIVVLIVAICGGIWYKKKKNKGFHKGTRENATAGDEGEPVQLNKHSSPVGPTLLDVKTSE